MRAVIQRVSKAQVEVEGKITGAISQGLVVLLGVGKDDTKEDLDYIYSKVRGLRIFADSEGKMNLSIEDVSGSILLVSQFTLYGDARKGRRPSFTESARPELAQSLYEEFKNLALDDGINCQTGVFGADMDLSLVNDGPVTIILDSSKIL